MQFRLYMQGTLPHFPCSSDCTCKGLSPTFHAIQIVHARDSPPLSVQFRLYMQGTLPHSPCSSDCACKIVHARDSPPLSVQFRLCMHGTLPHSPCSSDCACKGLSPTLHAVQIVHARGDSAWKQGLVYYVLLLL